jgi:hypothetical protein
MLHGVRLFGRSPHQVTVRWLHRTVNILLLMVGAVVDPRGGPLSRRTIVKRIRRLVALEQSRNRSERRSVKDWSERLDPGPQLDLPGPCAAWLPQAVEIGLRNRIGVGNPAARCRRRGAVSDKRGDRCCQAIGHRSGGLK